MSVENFKKFGQVCAEDENIREKVKQIGIENVEGLIAYGKSELGLEFDVSDMQELSAEVGSTDELSEEQLEQVAGGVATAGGAAAAAGAVCAATAVTDNVRRGW